MCFLLLTSTDLGEAPPLFMKLIHLTLLCLSLLSLSAVAEVRLVTGDANNNLHPNDSFLLDLSADGNLALFSSGPPASGIGTTPGIPTGGLYLRNITANTLTALGTTNSGSEATISDDGRYVTWRTPNNLIAWRDCHAGVTRVITPGADNASRNPVISADGRYVAYASLARNLTATNLLGASGRASVLLYDSQNETTTVASLTHDGKALSTGVGSSAPQTEFDFSADGNYVVFSTDSTNVHPSRASAQSQALFWLYRRNVQNGQVDVVSKNAANQTPYGNFTTPRIDATGNRIVFAGSFLFLTSMLTNNYTSFGSDLYLKDMTSGEVWWVTKTTNGVAPNAALIGPAINSNGTVVAFGSDGTAFVPENTDSFQSGDSLDIFRVDIGPGGTVTNSLITKAIYGTNNVGYITGPVLPGTGNYVGFTTRYFPGLLNLPSNGFNHGVAVGTLPTEVQAIIPSLNIVYSTGQVTLSWTNVVGFNLTYKTDLNDPSWLQVTNLPALSAGINTLTLPSNPAMKFFQLRNP